MKCIRKVLMMIGCLFLLLPTWAFSDAYRPQQALMVQGEGIMSEPPGVTITSNESGVEVKVVLAEEGDLDISILGKGDKKIRTLFKGPVEKGTILSVPWDGKDDTGVQFPSGSYVLDIETPHGPLHREGFFVSPPPPSESQGN